MGKKISGRGVPEAVTICQIGVGAEVGGMGGGLQLPRARDNQMRESKKRGKSSSNHRRVVNSFAWAGFVREGGIKTIITKGRKAHHQTSHIKNIHNKDQNQFTAGGTKKHTSRKYSKQKREAKRRRVL